MYYIHANFRIKFNINCEIQSRKKKLSQQYNYNEPAYHVLVQNAWKFYPEQEIQLSEIPKLQFRLSHQ